MNQLAALEVLTYSFALWFGLYLLGRDPRKPTLRYAGLGLVAYALSLAFDLLHNYAPELWPWGWPFALLPALFWMGAILHLPRDSNQTSPQLMRLIDFALPLGAATLYLVTTSTAGFDIRAYTARPLYLLLALVVASPLLTSLVVLWRASRSGTPGNRLGRLLTATLFFTLGVGLLLFPLEWLPREVLLLAIGGDLLMLGHTVAALDAFDEGEALLPDFLRSFGFSLFSAVLFGGQVALMMLLTKTINLPMLVLLLSVIAAAILTQTFSDAIQTAVERLVFARFPRLRRERASLRAVASALPRVDPQLDPHTLDNAEFTRLTRHALSHLGDLQRLAASPLTRLEMIDERLREAGETDNSLTRAVELKALLTESIVRLKPRGRGDFGSTDEWRYYNALYFPYVVGLKPYSYRAFYNGLDPASQAALEWFRAYVPERTLHNWQNAAARLIAQDLRERLQTEETNR